MMNAKGMERKELRRQVQATFTTHSPPKPALFAAITMCLSLHRNWTSKSTSPTLDTKPTNGLPIHLQGPQGKPLQVPSFLLHHLKHTLKTPRKKVSQSEPETPFSVPFLFLIILMIPTGSPGFSHHQKTDFMEEARREANNSSSLMNPSLSFLSLKL